MANDWVDVSLAEISVRIGDGLHGTPKYCEHGEYPFINGNNLENGSIVVKDGTKRVSQDEYLKHKKELTDNTVLVSINGTIGNVALYEGEEVVLGKSACYINLKDGVSKHFIRYILSGYLFQEYIQRCSTGSTIKNVSLKMMRDFRFKMPKTEAEQLEVIQSVRNLDSKITLNRQINQTQEQMAQTLFKSWFVDFDPVMDNALDAGNPIPDELQHRAEARIAVRESEGFKPLPYNVRQLFPDAFEESDLGWVPKGWMVSTAGDEFTVKGGSTPSTKSAEFWEGGDIHWTSPKDLSGKAEKILLDTERKITATGLSKITSGLLPPETVLMSSRAPVGYLAMTKVPVAINQGYIAITECKSLTQEFALYWLDSKIEMIKSISGGTTFAEISKKTFRTIPIVVPSAQAVNTFSETVALYLSKISNNVEECSSLGALRDSLLPKLMSGELEII